MLYIEVISQKLFPIKMTPRSDPAFLSKFIRSKKNDVSALKAVEKYYELGYRNLSVFEGAKPSDFTKAYDCGAVTVLKGRHEGSRVVIFMLNQ